MIFILDPNQYSQEETPVKDIRQFDGTNYI